jgi:hypothetical protein
MDRIEVLQNRMIQTMPLPAPTSGPRFGRIRLHSAAIGARPIAVLAEALTAAEWSAENTILATNTMGIESDTLKFKVGNGTVAWNALPYVGTVQYTPVNVGSVPGHEQQTETAIQQMSIGSTLARVASHDANYPTPNPIAADSWDIDQAAYWAFEPQVDSTPGAAGTFLDWWGTMLQVPRYSGESDDSYRVRIPATVMLPGIANKGMALLIDQMLGFSTFTGGVFTGTVVVDLAAYLIGVNLRLNNGHRLNNGLRLSPTNAYGISSTWNCFIVILPGPIPSGFTNAMINTLVNRIRAAGNRKVATIIKTTGQTLTP